MAQKKGSTHYHAQLGPPDKGLVFFNRWNVFLGLLSTVPWGMNFY